MEHPSETEIFWRANEHRTSRVARPAHSLRSPMNLPPVSLNAKENPQKNHCRVIFGMNNVAAVFALTWNETTAIVPMLK